MIWRDCLIAAVKEEKISQKTADTYEKYFADAEKEAAQLGKAGVDAYTFATSKGAERMMQAVGRKKEAIAADILRVQRAIEDIESHKVRGKTNLFEGLAAKLGETVRGGGVSQGLIAQQRGAYATMQSVLTDFIEGLRSKNFGLTRDRASARDAVIELYGKDSGVPSAKVNAEAWKKNNEWWTGMMDNEKVHIAKREDWFLPQAHNSLKYRAMGEGGFAAAALERIRDGRWRLRDWQSTGDAVLDPSKDMTRIMEILVGTEKKPGMWRNVTTHGDASIEPGVSRNDTLSSRYNKRRVVEITSPEAYFDFLDTFGNGADNLGDQFMRHLKQMSNDLGTARVMGGDPDKMARTLIQYGQSKGVSGGQKAALEATWFHASGKAQEAASVTLANTAQALRSWLASTQLGGAVLGSAPDFAFMRSTAAFNGLSGTKMMGHYLTEMKGDKRGAMQLGMIVDEGLRGLRDHFDDVLTENGGKMSLLSGDGLEAATGGAARVAGRAAEFVMRGTGLSHHSTSGRNAFGRAMLAELADSAHLPFEPASGAKITGDKAVANALNPRLRGFLERYGMDAADWNTLRTKAVPTEGEKLYMDPAHLAFNGAVPDREPALRLLGAIDAEMKLAIPEGGIATRARGMFGYAGLGTTQAGTWAGEALRSVQYKGFAASVMLNHGWRAIDQLFDKSGAMPRGQYMAALAIQATVLGAFSYQLKNIAAGKDPESMGSADFWAKAAAMGGSGGMLGDQIKTLMQTKSNDDAARLLSPTAGLFLKTAALSGGNFSQMIHGEKTNAGREAANYLKSYAMPRLWYTSLGVDRLGWDTLQRMWDPGAGGAFQRTEQRAKKDSDVSFWWRPGQTEPSRAPDLSRIAP